MELRAFHPDTDFERIKGWIRDEREHAMWCAGRFSYPLAMGDFVNTLSGMVERKGDTPFVADVDGRAEGFFCCSVNHESGEGMLKFVIVNPECRGKGAAREMLRLAVSRAFREAGAQNVSLTVFSVNTRAKKCYEKVGFAEKNTDCKAFAFRDELWDRCHMTIMKKDFSCVCNQGNQPLNGRA